MFLTETTEMVGQLNTLFPNIRAYRVPNFIHREELPETVLRSGGPPEVLYFGNVTPLKGVETVLDAVDKVCDSCKTTFHFIGGELDRGYLHQFRARAAQLRHADAVKIHGPMARTEAHQLARKCQIFAFPTQWPGEGQPATLVETMGMGMVPVVTRWRGVAEIVEDEINGLTIDAPDPGQLGECILKLLDNPSLLNTLSTRARATISAEYSEVAALEQYRRLLAGISK